MNKVRVLMCIEGGFCMGGGAFIDVGGGDDRREGVEMGEGAFVAVEGRSGLFTCGERLCRC